MEEHLSEALQWLSAQYEREQKRQAEQVEALQSQLSGFEQSLDELDEDHRQLGRDYRRIADALNSS